MAEDGAVTAAMEDYLEAILDLQESKGVARVKDIARRLGVRMPTVTGAIQGLVGRGLAHHERYEHVDLTRKGREVARKTQRQHAAILTFLTEALGLEGEEAEREACSMEHAMRRETVERLLAFAEGVEGRPARSRRAPRTAKTEPTQAAGEARRRRRDRGKAR